MFSTLDETRTRTDLEAPVSSDLLGIPPTHLPEDPAADALASGCARAGGRGQPRVVAGLGGARRGRPGRPARVESYAYARTGYHRGLDALRRAGWRGQGPVPWEHEPNRGFLRALAALARAADADRRGRGGAPVHRVPARLERHRGPRARVC